MNLHIGLLFVSIIAAVPCLSRGASSSLSALDLTCVFSTEGVNAQWFVEEPGVWRSGALDRFNECTLIAEIPEVEYVSFEWKVSSREQYDYIKFYVDGERVESISGEKGWTMCKHVFKKSKPHVLKWTFNRDWTAGENAGWVRNVFVPVPPKVAVRQSDLMQDGEVYCFEISMDRVPFVSGDVIRYTCDGTEPTAASPLYSAPFKVFGEEGSQTIKAGVFRNGVQVGEPTSRQISFDQVPKRWSITYENLYGSTHANPSQYREGDSFDFLPVLTSNREGYAFVGWLPDSIDENTSGDVCVAASWQANEYKIRYEPNGADGTMPPTYATYDRNVVIADNGFTFSGYRFCNWERRDAVSDPDKHYYDEGQIVSNLTAVAGGEIVLYAVWEKEPVFSKIQYVNLCGAVHGNPSDYQEGTSVTFTPPSPRTGYLFAGWEPSSISDTDTGDFTVKANWTPNSYTLFYDPNGGLGSMASVKCTYDVGVIIAANVFIREGYEFMGWALKKDGPVQYSAGTVVSNLTAIADGRVDLYAVWKECDVLINGVRIHPEHDGWKLQQASFIGEKGSLFYQNKSIVRAAVVGAGSFSFDYEFLQAKSGETLDKLATFIVRIDSVEYGLSDKNTSFDVELGSSVHEIEFQYSGEYYMPDGFLCEFGGDGAYIANGLERSVRGYVHSSVRFWNVCFVSRDPIPYLGEQPTPEEVESALTGSQDARLVANITDGAMYNAYRDWAMKLNGKGSITLQDIKDSETAWISFALDADRILDASPGNGDLVVEEFKPTVAAGVFEFTVGVKDVFIGANAAAENLKIVFGLEGTPSLGFTVFDPKNVTIEFGKPKDGKLKFTAKPNMGDSQLLPDSFFMKMMMR